jgi:hypothetical protein
MASDTDDFFDGRSRGVQNDGAFAGDGLDGSAALHGRGDPAVKPKKESGGLPL